MPQSRQEYTLTAEATNIPARAQGVAELPDSTGFCGCRNTKRLSGIIERLQTTPGRLVHPLEMASYDASIKLYRNDENSPNTTISYYTKGAVVAFLLDAKIQAATGGTRNLDDVLRLAYRHYAGERGFTREEFRALAQDVAGINLRAWFVSVLETTEELDYTEALDWFGLRFKTATPATPATPEKAWLGLVTRTDNGRLLISQVQRQTPGWQYGFNVDDEILAIDDYRVLSQHWETRLAHYRPGEHVTVLIARRECLQRLSVTFGAEPPNIGNWKGTPTRLLSSVPVWLPGWAVPVRRSLRCKGLGWSIAAGTA